MDNTKNIPAAIGAPFEGGFYAGSICIDGLPFALIVASQSDGERTDVKWNGSDKAVDGAMSYCDGLANTTAMAAAGSKLAQWALDLRIDGRDDWYLPSQDELEIIYRNLKPTDYENSGYARSGINLSAVEPTRPYTPAFPAQTSVAAFQAGGEQAFEATWYWSSTQHAANSDYAWVQHFGNGNQTNDRKGVELRARAVRRLAI